MKSIYCFLFLSTLCSFTLLENEKPAAKVYKYFTLFGCQELADSKIDKAHLDQLINAPLCVKDTSGKQYKVHSFEITYAERGLYEDSAGLPIIYTDYQNETFKCDTLSAVWKKMLLAHAYKGDTIHIENVVLVDDKNRNLSGAKPLHLIVK
jgi:hypothetical protein